MNTIDKKGRILYFPSMNLPNNDWLKTAMLFYDKILTIAPPDFLADGKIRESKVSNFEEHTKMLYEKGHIEVVESFSSGRDQDLFSDRLKPIFTQIKANKSIYAKELENNNHSRLFSGKFAGNVIRKLEEMNLVIEERSPNEWAPEAYKVPKSIGDVFMYQLAETLGELDYCTPSTDQKQYTFEIQEKNNPLLEQQKYFELVFPNIFPIPEKLSIDELINFRERFRPELIEYRKDLDIRLDSLQFVDKNKLELYLKNELKSINKEIDKLIELYQDAGINKWTFKDTVNTFKVLGGIFTSDIFMSLRGVLGLAGKRTPDKKNPFSYPAMFNYHFNGSTVKSVGT